MIRPENEMKICGTGIDLDRIIDFATIFSIKEAFIKASCGHVC